MRTTTRSSPTGLVAAMDMYAAEGVRNYRAGQSPNLREMGFTELADLLGM